MKIPSLRKTTIRRLTEQTDEERMYLLKLEAHRILGRKWEYFRKIKRAGESSGLFKEKSLFEEMKATQSALKFTSKNALRQYNLAYQNCLKEIKNFAVTDETFPDLPDENDGAAVREMIPKQDAVIIAWTPIKFLLPARQIREKGTASQRHTEGLLAKLFFKVVGYYAVPENWNERKLSFYLHKITADSTYQEVAAKLEPLKKDLYSFSEEFEPFKFGQATLSKDFTSDSDAFDDAMEVESFESQVKTLYWYGFIYRGLESFMLRYFLTLISATASAHAIRYLSNIFEPALSHVLDLSILFDGSFETDKSRKRFRKPFLMLKKERNVESLKKSIKTRQGLFEVYNHNLLLLARFGVPFSIRRESDKASFWRLFAERNILGRNRVDLDRELTYTPYEQLGRTMADTEKQNEILAGNVAQLTEELKELKSEIEGLKGETATLEKTYREEKPEEIKQQLVERKSAADKERQELEKQLKDNREAEAEIIKELQKLAQERDGLLEEEEQLKPKASEFEKTVEEFDRELKKIQEKLAVKQEKVEKAAAENPPDAAAGENAPEAEEKTGLETLKADIEQVEDKKAEAENRLNSVKEKLGDISEKRSSEIIPGFESAQEQQTKLLKEIEVLDRSLLEARKQIKQIGEEQTALEERDSRFADSKKKLDSALKNAEKNEEKTAKSLEDTKSSIEQNRQSISELQEKRETVLEQTKRQLQDLNSPEARSLALQYIMAVLITAAGKRKEAWEKVLERFKERMVADQELAKGRVDEIKKESAKKVRDMHKKAGKLKRLKQVAAAEDFEKEIEQYQKSVEENCQRIIRNAKQEAAYQKKRITSLYHNIEKEKKRSDAVSAMQLFELIRQMEEGESFKKEFMQILVSGIAKKYEKSLEPLYRNLFNVFRPTLLNRVSLVQALEKSGSDDGVRLKLSEEEQKSLDGIIQGARNQVRQLKQDLFDCRVTIQANKASLDTLLKIKLDNSSLRPILQLKFTSQSDPKGGRIDPSLADRVLHLNHIMNPVPEHNLLLEGKEDEKDPLQRINVSQLTKLISAVDQASESN